MAVQHVVLMRFNDDTDPTDIEALATGLRRLPSLIPQIATYAVGQDAGVAENLFQFAVSARFASVEDFNTYRNHPEHRALVSDLLEPICAERQSVQFEF